MIKVGWLGIHKNSEKTFHMGGGDSYRKYLFQFLKNSDMYRLNGCSIGGFLSRDNIISLYRSLRLKGVEDVWIHDMNTVIYPHKELEGSNILLFHHIGGDVPSPYSHLNKVLNKIFYRNLSKIDIIVVVSKFWEQFFQQKGLNNIRVIYNPFNTEHFKFKKKEINDFKSKYKLKDKPIVYIGNCHELKGVKESYENLKHLGVHLVTSGRKKINIPAVNLNLTHNQYLLLLKASSAVVTMSKFHEGWCRTAHEAMLCKTPVIGSGRGGMTELLEGGHQIICPEFNQLANYVEYALENPDLGTLGYRYASKNQFNIKNFNNEWDRLFKELSFSEYLTQ
jgi:glycosyltransferase involved in cell wall biosynthesis